MIMHTPKADLQRRHAHASCSYTRHTKLASESSLSSMFFVPCSSASALLFSFCSNLCKTKFFLLTYESILVFVRLSVTTDSHNTRNIRSIHDWHGHIGILTPLLFLSSLHCHALATLITPHWDADFFFLRSRVIYPTKECSSNWTPVYPRVLAISRPI